MVSFFKDWLVFWDNEIPAFALVLPIFWLCIGGYRLDGHVWAIAGSCLCWLWHFEGSDGTDWRSTPSTCSRLESDLRHSFLDHQIYLPFFGIETFGVLKLPKSYL